jgi:MFS family permease
MERSFPKLAPASFFTLFSALHSFIIGLLPFYLPILIWQQNAQLALLTEFIAWTGTGFVIALFGWHKLFTLGYWRSLVMLSFIFELSLIYLAVFHLDTINLDTINLDTVNLLLLGILNGLFNCSYWMLQRVLFNALSDTKNSGRLFGNLQLILGLSLKLGILLGGYFMQVQPELIFLLSLVIAVWFCAMSLRSVTALQFIYPVIHDKKSNNKTPVHQLQVNTKISLRDKIVFIVDGPFLYLESYLWILSIFHLSNNDTGLFSLTIIALSVALGIIFYFIKNTIDKQSQYRLYQIATLLYVCGWVLRGWVTPQWSGLAISLTLLCVAFVTALFRLYFNKRFFDNAKQQASYHYLFSKSLYSQIGICLFFALLTLALRHNNITLNEIYWLILPMTLVYMLYRETGQKEGVELRVANGK